VKVTVKERSFAHSTVAQSDTVGHSEITLLPDFPAGRDSAHNNEQKLLTLPLDEFLRRFLLHLLPKGFVHIRNFGFLANRRRAILLPLCFQLLGAAQQPQVQKDTAASNDLWCCPKCGGPMVVVERLTAAEIQLRSPPMLTAA
jgi:hypothetical protein